jgi:MOSC domain-containing protein YiiM
MREPDWLQRFTDRGDTGCYFRVLRKGAIAAGDRIAVEHRPGHGVTVRDIFRGPTPEQASALREGHEAGAWVLPAKVLRLL